MTIEVFPTRTTANSRRKMWIQDALRFSRDAKKTGDKARRGGLHAVADEYQRGAEGWRRIAGDYRSNRPIHVVVTDKTIHAGCRLYADAKGRQGSFPCKKGQRLFVLARSKAEARSWGFRIASRSATKRHAKRGPTYPYPFR